MILWAEQAGEGRGELELETEEKVALLRSGKSRVVILVDPLERTIASIFASLPNEYGGFGITGKRYDAIKDYLEWHGLEPKEFAPLLVKMGEVWAQKVRE